MKILIACGILPPEIGGPATVVPAVAAELRDAGHEVSIVTYTENPVEIRGVSIRSVSRSGSLFFRYLRLARAIKSQLPDKELVLATDVVSVGIPARLALTGRRQRLALRLGGEWRWERAVSSGTWRGTLRDYWSQEHGLADRLWLWNYRWIVSRASLVVTTSDLLRDLLTRQFSMPHGSVSTIPNFVTVETVSTDHHRPHRPLRLIYAGRFAPVKNLPFFARVLRTLHERGTSVTCTFVGDGDELDECRQILAGVPGSEFTGRIPRPQLFELYARHDVFVLPSLSDICPNSVLEARACGLPCVISSETGLPRPLPGVVEVDPTDARAWVAALSHLTSEDAYQALARQPQGIVSESEIRWSRLLEAL